MDDKCVATSQLPLDGVASDSLGVVKRTTLVDMSFNDTATSLMNLRWPSRSTAPTFYGIKICWVVTRTAYNKGYSYQKLRELTGFMHTVYQTRSRMPIQFTEPQIIIDWAGELDNYGQTAAAIAADRRHPELAAVLQVHEFKRQMAVIRAHFVGRPQGPRPAHDIILKRACTDGAACQGPAVRFLFSALAHGNQARNFKRVVCFLYA